MKDAFAYPGTRTVSSTRLQDYVPDRPAATCIANLEAAGAILIGKNNVGSGMAPPKLVAIAVSADEEPVEVRSHRRRIQQRLGCECRGRDGARQRRHRPRRLDPQPGVVLRRRGLKPTHGLVSLDGNIFGMGTRAEHVGPLADQRGRHRPVPRRADRQRRALLVEEPADPPASPVAAFNGGGIEAALPTCCASWKARTTRSALPASTSAGRHARKEEALWLFVTLFDEWEAVRGATPTSDQYLAYIAERLRLRRGRTQQSLDVDRRYLARSYDELFESHDVIALGTAPITAPRFDQLTGSGAARDPDQPISTR